MCTPACAALSIRNARTPEPVVPQVVLLPALPLVLLPALRLMLLLVLPAQLLALRALDPVALLLVLLPALLHWSNLALWHGPAPKPVTSADARPSCVDARPDIGDGPAMMR